MVFAHALVDAHGRERKQLEMHLFADNGVGSVPGKQRFINGKTRYKLGRLNKHICWADQSKTNVRIDKQYMYSFFLKKKKKCIRISCALKIN